MTRIFINIVALASVMTFASTAQASKLSGREINNLIAGKRVMLATRWGSFPLRYRTNKRVTGDGSALGLARFFAPKETGNWWIASNQLCQRFPTWYKGQSFCFSITQTGTNTIRWVRNDGYAGTATISK